MSALVLVVIASGHTASDVTRRLLASSTRLAWWYNLFWPRLKEQYVQASAFAPRLLRMPVLAETQCIEHFGAHHLLHSVLCGAATNQ